MDYVFSDADILIKLIRSDLWCHFEKLISIRKWNVHIPTYVLHTEVKNTDQKVYNFLISRIDANIISEIDTEIDDNNPVINRFASFSQHVGNGEAHVFALAESMNAIAITDNRTDLKIIQKHFSVNFKSYTLYQLCYLIFKEKLLTEAQINKCINKLVQTGNIKSSDPVVGHGFRRVILKLDKENFD